MPPISPPEALRVARDEAEALDAELLDADGRFRIMPTSELRAYGYELLRAWMVIRGRYMLPTRELVSWISDGLDNALSAKEGSLWSPRNVVEVGAGMGDLGRALGVHMTDSGVQGDPALTLIYRAMGQAITVPPKEVERLDAIAAAKKYKPKVILASWVTQAYQHGDTEASVGSCMYGPNESHLIRLCQYYVFIGNKGVHGDKRILKEPHETHNIPWIVSRAKYPSLDRVWIWRRR